MTENATIKTTAVIDPTVLRVGERDCKKDPDRRNGTISTLVCAGLKFPAKCYDGWTVRVGDEDVTGTYAHVVTVIRAYVVRVAPKAAAKEVRLQKEAARLLEQQRADYAARVAKGARLLDQVRTAAERASAAAGVVAKAFYAGYVSDDVLDYVEHYRRQAAQLLELCEYLQRRRPGYWFEDAGYIPRSTEEAAEECERIAQRLGWTPPAITAESVNSEN